MNSHESLQPTRHPLISRTQVPPLDPAVVDRIAVTSSGNLTIELAETVVHLSDFRVNLRVGARRPTDPVAVAPLLRGA